MSDKPKIEVDFQPTGLKAFNASLGKFADTMLEPMLLLAAGATKTEAALAGIRGVVEYKMLGPLGLLSGAAIGAVVALKKLTIQFKDLGMSAAADIQTLETQFKPLLKSTALATEKVKELVEVAKKTPFQQENIIKAAKTLQILSQGALSGKEGLELMGDAAAAAGVDLETVSLWGGRMYDALQSGTPIGMATMRMQELGLMSGNTRRQLEAMQESGASFTDMWAVMTAELKKSEGSMYDLSETIEGLHSTLADTKTILGAGFSGAFLKGESAAIKTTTILFDELGKVANDVAPTLAAPFNFLENVKLGFTEKVAETGALGAALKGSLLTGLSLVFGVIGQGIFHFSKAGKEILDFRKATSATADAAAQGAKGVGLLSDAVELAASGQHAAADAARATGAALVKSSEAGTHARAIARELGNAQYHAAVATEFHAKASALKAAGDRTGALAAALSMRAARQEAMAHYASATAHATAGAASTAHTVATNALTGAKTAAVGAGRSIIAGNLLEALSYLKVAAAQTFLAVRTNAATVAMALMSRTWQGLKFVGVGLIGIIKGVISSMILNSVLGWGTAIAALSVTIIYWVKSMETARKELAAFKQATEDMARAAAAGLLGIRNENDLLKEQALRTRDLIEAKRELREAEEEAENQTGIGKFVTGDAAGDKLKAARKRVDAAQAPSDKANSYDRDRLGLKDEKKEELRKKVEDDRELQKTQRAENRSIMNPDQLKADLEMELKEIERAYQLALREKQNYDVTSRAKKNQAVTESTNNTEMTDLQARLAKLKEDKKEYDSYAEMVERTVIGPRTKEEIDDLAGNLGGISKKSIADFENLDKYEARLKELQAIAYDQKTGMAIGLVSESEIARLEDQKRLIEDIRAAAAKVPELQGKLTAEKAKDKPDTGEITKLTTDLDIATRELSVLEGMAKGAQIAIDEITFDKIELRLEKLKQEMEIAKDPQRRHAGYMAAKEAGVDNSQKDLEAKLRMEAAIAGLKDEGLAMAMRELAMEEKKLDLIQQGLLAGQKKSDDELAASKQEIATRKALLEKNSKENRGSAINTVLLNVSERREASAREVGDIDAANAERSAGDIIRNAELEKRLRREAKDLFASQKDQDDYVKFGKAEEEAKRKADRDREEKEMKDQKRITVREANQERLEMSSDLKLGKGDVKGYREDKKKAEGIQDDIDRQNLINQFQDQGFDEKTAGEMAGRQVKMNQIKRQMEDMDGGEGHIVASSLAKIGGGGAVVTPPQSRPDRRLKQKNLQKQSPINNSTFSSSPGGNP